METIRNASPETLANIEAEKEVRKTNEVFLLFPMGSQFDHLIYQRVSARGVFCIVADPASLTAEDVRAINPIGIILSGGPASEVTEPPPFDRSIFNLGIPGLGICLGSQMMAKHIGATIVSTGKSQFSTHTAEIIFEVEHELFKGCPTEMPVLQSHGDKIIPDKTFVTTAMCDGVIAGGYYGHLHCVQFHPEVTETTYGDQIFENFCFGICKARDRFPAEDIAKRKIAELREQIRGKRGILLLSGGSDSSVVAYLFKNALAGLPSGEQVLRAVYIEGIDRPDDKAFVLKYFGGQDWIELVIVNAADRFLEALAGKTKMREKRVSMRGVYKAVAEEQKTDFKADYFAQGTLQTDITESGGGHTSGARKAVIKLHHNTNLDFSVPEIMPLSDCVKDGARNIGREIGVPEELLTRHPFPGPGLVVRIEGEVTAEKLRIARALDGIYIEELWLSKLYHAVWQAGVVITTSEHTYTKGDDAGSGPVVTYWAVWSTNGYTAQSAELPMDFHRKIARRFGNEVPGIGAVTYRMSDKPFSTIEWG